MRKKTKKSFLVAIGVALCLAFGGTAFAIDNDSLESRTTEGLYDRTDPYDLTMEPGLLYKLDRWRLYTNLSGYSGDDDMASESYIIGTSGKLGAGSLAVFYETNKSELEDIESATAYFYDEDQTGTFPNYDGSYDDIDDVYGQTDYDAKTEGNNFHLAYSIDFGGVSVGLSYAPEFEESETSVQLDDLWLDVDDLDDDLGNASFGGTVWFDPNNLNSLLGFLPADVGEVLERIEAGTGFAFSGSTINYDPTDHTLFEQYKSAVSFSGKNDTDRTEHPISVQSQIHTSEHWHLLAGIRYASIEEDDDLSAVFRESSEYIDTNSGEWADSDLAINVSGSLDEDYEGDEWSIYLEPVYEVNDMVSLRMDLEYSMEDGDFDGGRVGTMNYTEKYRSATGADTETITEYERWDGSSKGDYDETEWGIEPRVYLTFDKVRFALGVGYHYSKEEWDGTEKRNYSSTYTYDDGDGVATAADYTVVGSSSLGYANFDGEEKTTRWRFPVATEFDVTDKLTLRAGAAYSRVHVKSKETETEVEDQNNTYTYTDGAGNVVVNVGPDQYRATATAAPVAYDANPEGSTYIVKMDETYDYTTYNLGLGYTFTENLKCDLMWTGKGAGGGVDMTEVFASVTLTF